MNVRSLGNCWETEAEQHSEKPSYERVTILYQRVYLMLSVYTRCNQIGLYVILHHFNGVFFHIVFIS